MQDVVVALSGDDAEERRRWQVAMSDLVDAILSDAIAASALDFPSDHAFWGPFSRSRAGISPPPSRRLATGSMGSAAGWTSAIPRNATSRSRWGTPGLDPMRMRHWPNEAEMAVLFGEVEVAADEHLAGVPAT